jgi:hypothetical protein
MMQPDLSV